MRAMLAAAATSSGWLGPHGAGTALLSLLTMWPFVAAAASLRPVGGEPGDRLGLRRAAGWFVLANLAGLLVGAAGGPVGAAWAAIVPAVNDPVFLLRRQEWAIVLELAPFFAVSVAAETVTLCGMNLRPPRGEQVRRVSLGLLAGGKNVLAYAVYGLTMWVVLAPSLGGYERILDAGEGRRRLASAGAGGRIWYVPPGGTAVRSRRLDGSDERVEWPGPLPRPYGTLWVVPRRGLVVLAGGQEGRPVRVVDLATGQMRELGDSPAAGPATDGRAGATSRPAGEGPGSDQTGGRSGGAAARSDGGAGWLGSAAELAAARSDGGAGWLGSAAELAAALDVRPGEIWPNEFFRASGAGRGGRTEWSALGAADGQARRRDAAVREQWVRRFGQGRKLPEVPARAGWRTQQEVQAWQGGRLIVARYGYRLVALEPLEGWLTPLEVSAEAYVIVPAGQGGRTPATREGGRATTTSPFPWPAGGD